MAAFLGMLFPALIYLLLNAGTPEAQGWGIPMATDIASHCAVVHALGDRVMFLGNRLGVKNVVFYGVLGIGGVWIAFLTSGIHATISAVLAAMVIPADSHIPEATFLARMRKLTRLFEKAESNDVRTLEPEQVRILTRVKKDSLQAMPPLQRLEQSMHPMVSFVIMPIFALANAGVSFVDMDLSALFISS